MSRVVHHSRCFFSSPKTFFSFLRYFLRTNPSYAMSQKMSSFYIWSKTLLIEKVISGLVKMAPCPLQWGLCCPYSSSPSGCPSAAVWKEGPVQKILKNVLCIILVQRTNPKKNMAYGTPCRSWLYNLTLCPLQSRLQDIYHGHPYARVDLNFTVCQSRLYLPVGTLDLASGQINIVLLAHTTYSTEAEFLVILCTCI